MSSWLRRRKSEGLRSELKVAPQIDQVTGNDLIPPWRKMKRSGREEGGHTGGRDEMDVRDSEGEDGQRGH